MKKPIKKKKAKRGATRALLVRYSELIGALYTLFGSIASLIGLALKKWVLLGSSVGILVSGLQLTSIATLLRK